MAVYVDELRCVPTDLVIFKAGSCHLVADSRDELHRFAEQLGMKREWFQHHALLPHYDLTPGRRARAVKLGAIETTTRALLTARRRKAG